MLTRKQHELIRFIQVKLEETGVSPSFEEMKEALDLKSKSGVHRLISALEERGFIRRLPNRARALEVLKQPEDVVTKAPRAANSNAAAAAVIRPQLPLVADRVAKGRAGHDRVAARLNTSAHLAVPPALPPEERAPDSIQFNLCGDWTDTQALAFQTEAKKRGVSVQVFGLSEGNARAFWNWEFLGPQPDLPQTRAMLMRACDVRLPTRLTEAELDFIAEAIVAAAEAVRGRMAA